MSPLVVGIIGIIFLLVLLFIGMNIAFSMIVVGFVGYTILVNMKAALGLFATIPFNTVANYGFSVIPLFVLMGQFMYYAGVSGDLYSFCHKWIGRISGGLASATIVACAFFIIGLVTAIVGIIADMISGNRKIMQEVQYELRRVKYGPGHEELKRGHSKEVVNSTSETVSDEI